MWHSPMTVRTVAVTFPGLAPVAQLDRAGGFYPSGCAFESCRGRRPGRPAPDRPSARPRRSRCPVDLTYAVPIEFRGSIQQRPRRRPTAGCSAGGRAAGSARPVSGPPAPAGRRPPASALACVVVALGGRVRRSPTPRPRGRCRPRAPALSGASFTETWTTGHLPDDGGPIALSSPVPVTLGGQPSVVVGDRLGNLFAYHLGGSSAVGRRAGWPATDESGPIDSTPSVATSGGQTSVLVGSGNDGDPVPGGYPAFGPSGIQQWFTPVVNPPTDTDPAGGVQAGLAVGTLQSGRDRRRRAPVRSVRSPTPSSAPTGAPLTGWPFFNTDSTHSTAALADLYGTGQTEIVDGGGPDGRHRQRASRTRRRTPADPVSAQGNLICRADTNQVVDSSPAVGGFLAGGATGIVVGTGGFFPDASDTDTVKAYDTRCRSEWSATARRRARSRRRPCPTSSATDRPPGGRGHRPRGFGGSVWVLDAATGQTIWQVTRHRPGHRLRGHRRSDRNRPRRHPGADHRTARYVLDGRTGAPDRRPRPEPRACRTRRWSPPTPTGRSGSRWPATAAPAGRPAGRGDRPLRDLRVRRGRRRRPGRRGRCSTTIRS